MTQRALGDVLGVENTTIAGWESGSSFPEFKRLVDIRQYFGVELESIVFHDLESNQTTMLAEGSPEYSSKLNEYVAEISRLKEELDTMKSEVRRLELSSEQMDSLASRLELVEKELRLMRGKGE